jgi:hypothetical protein
MTDFIRVPVAVAFAAALGVAAIARQPAASENLIEILISNGPHAGTYKLPTDPIICMDRKQQKEFTAVYKDFDAKDPKVPGTAAIHILNYVEPGPKQGSAFVTFRDSATKPGARYSVEIFRDGTNSLTITRNPKGADLAFQGKTKEGITLRMTATCTSIDVL